MSGLFDRWLASLTGGGPEAGAGQASVDTAAEAAPTADAEVAPSVPAGAAEAEAAPAEAAPSEAAARPPRRQAPPVLDTVLAAAVDVARTAITEVAGESEVGAHLGVVAEGTRLVTHSFVCTNPAYRGWHWVAVLARAPRSKKATVCETALLPGADALVSPAWVPWEERLEPGDMGPQDVLPRTEHDPNLELGLEQVDVHVGDDIDQVPNFEFGLGRARVLSREGIENAAKRWARSDAGPDGEFARKARGQCSTCGFLLPIAGSMRTKFGVCANEWAPFDGRIVALDAGCGAHSETDVHHQSSHTAQAVIDDFAEELDLVDLNRQPEEAHSARMSSMFQSLAEPNYRRWFGGALVSNTGTWMQRTAQDWIVLTQLTDEDATALGICMALQLGPQLLLFPVAGTLADRFRRRWMLLLTQILQGSMGLILFTLTVTDAIQLWHVYVLALSLGVVATVDAPVRQAFVSELVGERLLPNAVSLNSASFNSARMVGPALAGVLTAALGASTVFLLSGLAFAATVTVLLTLDGGALHSPSRETRRGPGRGVMGGFRYLRTRPDILVVLAILFVVSTFGINFNIYTATMARMEFGRDATGFGLLNSVLAVGSPTGALLAARRERPRLRMIFWGAGAFGAACAASALMPTYATFAIVLTTVGLASITMLTAANAYVQSTTPAGVRGRVMSIYLAVLLGGAPIGAPFAGWVADTLGARAALGVGAASGAVGFLIGVVWMMTAKNLRVRYVRRSRRFVRLSYDGRGGTPRA